MRRQSGFTLVEVMIALVVMLIVTGGMYKLLTTTQKLSRAQAEQSSLQSNVRSGALVVPNELRELNTVVGGLVDQNDIINNLNANDITYRAMRGFGITCGAAPAGNQIRVYGTASATHPFSGYRNPEVNRDGVYIFSEGADLLHAKDDGWIRRTITGVTAAPCAVAGNPPGITLTLDAAVPGPPDGTPVRTFEVMQLQLYVDAAGESWLGARSVNVPAAVIQPVLGPLTAGNGFELAYFDANNVATGVKENVKSITVTVRGLSDQLVNTGTGGGTMAYAHDSLATRVLLRNSIRP
jgi:prepilin-type N-terminal cleavage/methylation domain-containing protein